MSRRLKKWLSGYRRGKGFKVPRNVVVIAVVMFIIFVVGGGFYDIVENPPALIPGPSGWVAVHPYMDEQTLNESIFAMVTTASMFVGLLLAYKSTQVRYDRKRANAMLMVGIALILLGLSGNYYIIYLKRSLS